MSWWDDLLKTLTQPSTIFGGGLTLAGGLMDKEPGEVLEARQALRNQFTSPSSALLPDFSRTGTDWLTGLVKSPADPFAEGGAFARYLPMLEREEGRSLGQLEQIYGAAFPASAGMQGSATAALRRAAGEFTQNRQTLVADLLREQQGRQQSAANSLLQYGLELPRLQQGAARDVLQFSRPDPTASALANLGTMIAMSNLLKPGTTVNAYGGAGGLAPGGFSPGRAAGGITGNPQLDSAIQGALQGIPGAGQALQALLSSVVSGGGQALSGAGSALSGALQSMLSGQGALGPAGVGSGAGLLSSAGAGVAGYFGGKYGGPWLAQQAESDSPWRWLNPSAAGLESLGAGEQGVAAWTGAQAGALAGFATGGPLGAVIGAITGAFGSFSAVRKQQQAQKAQFRTDDVSSQLDQVFEIGNVGAELLSRAGVPQDVMNSFQSFVEAAAARSEGPGNEQGEVAAEMNRLLTAAGYPAGSRPPEWRQHWIDYLLANTFTSGNSAYGGGAPQNFIRGEAPGWLNLAQLKQGGRVNSPTLALVGEAGPEWAYLPPGAVVMPMRN